MNQKVPQDKSFWDWTGLHFPSLTGAPSTRYYRDCEISLFEMYSSPLKGLKVFKTDLWDEAKNTLILQWVQQHGADVFGSDISWPIVNDAQKALMGNGRARFAVSDVRNLAYASESFDLIYSMGTIEHFREYQKAIAECYRVLRRGGKAIIGVPNRFDPFLRPVLVRILQSFGRYAYGYERSFSRSALQQLLQDAGFHVLDTSGVLFMPGWLRMLDLFIFTKWPRASHITGLLVSPFAYLYRKFPLLRRHGYLIACIAEKP